jgi:hypothetical protein
MRCYLYVCSILCCISFVAAARAGSISEEFISATVQSLDPAQRAANGGIQASLWVVLFYIFYLGTIWSFNIAMLITEPKLSAERRHFARYFLPLQYLPSRRRHRNVHCILDRIPISGQLFDAG